MYTLFIDTHDKNVLIILYKDGKIFNVVDKITNNKHSEVTMPAIDALLKKVNVDVTQLSNVIVVNGPGSFTGERIAVTIAKTIAYSLSIPIRVIDALTILALHVESDIKIVSLEDRNGAFVGIFDSSCNPLEQFKYMNKSSYIVFKEQNDVVTHVNIDYEKVYNFVMKQNSVNPHEVKPLYVKGISALDGR